MNPEIFYDDGAVRVRDMIVSDARVITDAELAQGWHATVDKYLTRLAHQREGRCTALVAEYRGEVAGYIHIYPGSSSGAFAGRGWPEIVDFGVLEKFRRRGVGGRLMDVAEQIAARYADTVYLGVGLHSGYGSAQRMYVKRGYVPDGSGVWYRDAVCPPYSACANDDDLVLYMVKKLIHHEQSGTALR